MATLTELLGSNEKRAAVVDDSLQVLDEEVQSKGGLGGMAIKGAYKVVQGVSPDFLRRVVDGLLDEFLAALDPIYQEALANGKDPKAHLTADPSRVADALLSITDQRAQRTRHVAIAKAYDKLRGSAKKHVEAAVPRLGQLFGKHVH